MLREIEMERERERERERETSIKGHFVAMQNDRYLFCSAQSRTEGLLLM